MRRYESFDPPEYFTWAPSADLDREYDEALPEGGERTALVAELPVPRLLDFYRGLLRFRLHDIALMRWVKQGVISKAWLGTGEEAVTIGTVKALRRGDFVGPMIRNAGACHEMGMPLQEMFAAYLATSATHTGGRDIHVGDLELGIVAPISHVGALVPVCAGIALASKMQGRSAVALTYVGDGATKVGEVHEGINFAAVLELPLLVVIQMNHVALGTRTAVHSRHRYEDLGAAYGIPLLSARGNHVLDTWAAAHLAVEHARSGKGAVLLLCETFRMGGHATHDEAEARRLLPAEDFATWGARDPIGSYEQWLLRHRKATLADLTAIEDEVIHEVDAAQARAFEARDRDMPDPATLTRGVYAEPS